VGNAYSDEILFQAGFYPRGRTKELEEDELKKVYKAMWERSSKD
jgi:formamidopyrimidine-DNA glycosylase